MESATINLARAGRVSLVVGETTLEMSLKVSPEAQTCHSSLVSLDEICRIHVRRVLVSCDGNRCRAAQILGIGRTTLYRRYLKAPDYIER